MLVQGKPHRSIWLDDTNGELRIIDQTLLPWRFETRTLDDLASVIEAIRTMRVRGAPLIGVAAAHGLALALAADPSDEALAGAANDLVAARPTAVNLGWAVARVVDAVRGVPPAERPERARLEAIAICDEDVASCESIGDHGLVVLEALSRSKRGEPLRILTHCNAGWLATVDWGTALAPIYKAKEADLPIHVWVDETRPRNQGASLTAFELREQGIPHTVIVDNAGGHLMQRGMVDLVLVGSDRTTATGDVCNKIGTYLKALAADANRVPFFVALPVSTIDWQLSDGLDSIPIEERDGSEVREIVGMTKAGRLEGVELLPESSPVMNPAFDITPARHVTGLITDYGVFDATATDLAALRERMARDGQNWT